MARALVQPVTDSVHPARRARRTAVPLRHRTAVPRSRDHRRRTLAPLVRAAAVDRRPRPVARRGRTGRDSPAGVRDRPGRTPVSCARPSSGSRAPRWTGSPRRGPTSRTVNAWASRPDLAPRFDRIGGGVERTGPATVERRARHAGPRCCRPVRRPGRALAFASARRPTAPSLFLDTSRAGRRRWCSMATCGNRQKVAAYRRRRTPSGATGRRSTHSPLERSNHGRAAARRG